MAASPLLTPVILSGGSGTRLWPMSRPERPKQFIALTASQTMFELTVARTAGLTGTTAPIVIANAAHGDTVRRLNPGDMTLILEPAARNTAPAIALAALAMPDPDGLMLIMPSDHVIDDVPAFHAAIACARPLAEQGWLVTFGIVPDRPETDYGYIAQGEALDGGACRVARFVEKPDLARAREMLAAGGHFWNAGIFLFRARAYLDALARFEPAMSDAALAAMTAATRTGNSIAPDAAAFAASPSKSIDYAVMEQAERIACVPVRMGWSDVGNWDALYALARKDEAGNSSKGPVRLIEAGRNLVQSEGLTVTLLGVEDLIVVATEKDVLVLPRGRAGDVRKAAELAKG